MNQKLDILAVAAHPDDAELACSGTILKHIAQGLSVGVVDLTRGELGSRGSADLRDEEAAKSSEILGLSARVNLDLGDGFFEINEVALKSVVAAIRRFKPEIVLCNAKSDRHPDHGRGGDLVSRACFLSGLVKIETSFEGQKQEVWRPKAVYRYIQDHWLHPDMIVDITGFEDKKMEAILAFGSQFYDPNSDGPKTPISGKDFLEHVSSRNSAMGRLIGVDSGEGFTVERPMGIENLLNLK